MERCQNVADENRGLEQHDVDVLKLLYLILYVDDIPATLDNIVILMADDIRMDTAAMREKMRGSLDRLLRQNYIGRNGEEYKFLTDEEQNVAKEIHNTNVDTSAIVEKLGRMIFEDIYTIKKYRYGRNDFEFDKMVDNITVGTVTGGMRLCVLTVATDPIEKNEMHLMEQSDGQAIIVLPETKYYESVENAMKIRKYVKQRNVSQLTSSMQAIIRDWQSEADNYEKAAMNELEKAIENADFYVDKEHLVIKGTGAKSKIDQALEYLVAHVYSDLELITKNIDSDDEIYQILRNEEIMISGMEQNRDAVAKMEEYLEIQEELTLPTSMADVQNKFQGKPNGWREIDIAAVAAKLIADQKVTIKYGATIIQPDNPKLPDMLRKKNETGKTKISLRKLNSAADIREARDFLREYFDVMDVPEDEDGLIKFIIESFGEQKDHYAELENRYSGHKYPDHALVSNAINLINDILSQQKDNIALVKEILKRRDDLEDNKEKMQRVENFFKSQVKLFDTAVKLEADLQHELDYLSSEPEANDALNQIRLICMVQPGEKFNYKRIPELNGLISKVHEGHDRLLDTKREDLLEDVRQCREAIHMMDNGDNSLNNIVGTADDYYTEKEDSIKKFNSLALLDGLTQQMAQYKDTTLKKMEAVKHPKVVPTHNDTNKSAPKKVYRSLSRAIAFPAKRIESEEDIKNYVEQIQDTLLQYLKNYGGIDLK
ncbi:MAG: BREX system P-loop protein BrxC [Clostridiales bacterium]|nr:BREX system P-loop protein BrxC [Clostridiales bacterium]